MTTERTSATTMYKHDIPVHNETFCVGNSWAVGPGFSLEGLPKITVFCASAHVLRFRSQAADHSEP